MAENGCKAFYEAQMGVLGIKFPNSGTEMKVEAHNSMSELLKHADECHPELAFKLYENCEIHVQIQYPNSDKSEPESAGSTENTENTEPSEGGESNEKHETRETFHQRVIDQNAKHFPNTTLSKHLETLESDVQVYALEQTYFYRGELNSPVERCLVLATSTLSYPDQDVPKVQFLVLLGTCPAQISDLIEACRKMTDRKSMIRSLELGSSRQGIHSTNSIEVNANEFKISMSAELEMQEDFGDGKWHTCHIDKDSFKLRANFEKRICITVKQDPQQLIRIEKCFGMLLSPGRYVGSADMVAIGSTGISVSDVVGSRLKQWTVIGSWIPSELNFELLNTETSGDSRVYFSIAIDLIIEHIDEPVRFIFETKAKIVQPSQWSNASATEKIWQLANFSTVRQRHLLEHFQLVLVPEGDPQTKNCKYKVTSVLSLTQFNTQKKQLSLQLNSIKNSLNNNSGGDCKSLDSVETPVQDEMDSDDEPLASGTGQVSKECTQEVLEKWKLIMDEWRKNYDVRPRNLTKMVRKGVPEALRPEVWQVLSGANQVEKQLLKQYTALLATESKFEAVIRRDISRTFPAHEMFKEPGGIGQESLFKICKAYSNYDVEIGYCQGLSFLIAALLLHMPEEQAFCVLVRIMYHYRLRELYKSGFEELHCKFYQLERLLQDQIPELSAHFYDLHIETHMYASQWFLTLYTTKFPLNAVFLIIDLFLLDEMDTLLQIAVAMLKLSKGDLLTLDFEGILKYFRINLPKKYRNEENAQKLIRSAVKSNTKKAARYETEYKKWQESEKIRLNPLEYLEQENKKLINMNIRLEQENDDLSTEIMALCKLKGQLQNQIANLGDKVDTLGHELNRVHTTTMNEKNEMEEERGRLSEELKNLKELYRSEVERSEKEANSQKRIIEDYKNICKSRETMLEEQKTEHQTIVDKLRAKLESCESCSKTLDETISEVDSNKDCESSKQNDLTNRIADLQAELIRTKLALAEAGAMNDEINSKLHKTNSELNLVKAQNEQMHQQRSNTWFSKTFMSSIRDATKTVRPSNSVHGFQGQSLTNPETASLHEMTNMTNDGPDIIVKRRYSNHRETISQSND